MNDALTAAQAYALATEVFSEPVVVDERSYRIQVEAPGDDGISTIGCFVFDSAGQIRAVYQQELALLLSGGTPVSEGTYRAYLAGARLAAGAFDEEEEALPEDLFDADLLALLPPRTTPLQIAHLLRNRDQRDRLLAPGWLDGFRREHRLEPIAEEIGLLVYQYAHLHQDRKRAALQLRRLGDLSVVPYVLCLLEDWAAEAERLQGELRDEGYTLALADVGPWVADAKLLEPLLARVDAPEALRRTEALRRRGLLGSPTRSSWVRTRT